MLQAETPLLLPQAYTLYLARHATPDRSRYDLPYHTPPGPQLTEKGRDEAAQMGRFLRQVGVRHILASPLERAWRTAVIAAAPPGEPPSVALAETQPEAADRAALAVEGQVLLTAEDVLVELNVDLAEHRPNESDTQVLARVLRAFDLAAQLSAARGSVALVSHGSPVMLLLKHLGLPAEIIERSRIYEGRNLVPPAGVWQVCREPAQVSLRLVFVPDGVRRPAVEEGWIGLNRTLAE
jgi:2,3-bisphosphoglycerate-dependent phosphoglycerate mutase